jgi:hypothetical protein
VVVDTDADAGDDSDADDVELGVAVEDTVIWDGSTMPIGWCKGCSGCRGWRGSWCGCWGSWGELMARIAGGVDKVAADVMEQLLLWAPLKCSWIRYEEKIQIMHVRRLRLRKKDGPYIDAPPGEEPVRQLFVTLLQIKRERVSEMKRHSLQIQIQKTWFNISKWGCNLQI